MRTCKNTPRRSEKCRLRSRRARCTRHARLRRAPTTPCGDRGARRRPGSGRGRRTVERPWQRSKPPSKGKRTEPRSPESLSWVCISVKCEHHPTNTCSHVFVASLWEGGPNEGVCDAPGGSRGGSREDDQGTAGPWVSQAGHPSSTRPGVGSAASWSLDGAMSGQLPMRERPAAPAGIPNGTRNARAKTYLYPVSPLSETSPEE